MSLQLQPNFEKILLEIAEGKSIVEGKAFFIKHLGLKDNAKIELFKRKTELKLLSEGAKTEKEILSSLISSGVWSESEEKALTQKRNEYNGVSKSLNKIINPREQSKIKEHLNNLDKEIKATTKKRNQYFGNTLESGLQNIVGEYQVSLMMVNESLNQIVDWEDWEYLSESEAGDYIIAYNNHVKEYSIKTLSNIGLQNFFWSIFQNYPAESPYLLWGRSAQDLTNYQCLVGERAKRIRKIFENNANIPDSACSDYEELIKWINGPKKEPELPSPDIEKNKGKKVSLFKDPTAFS